MLGKKKIQKHDEDQPRLWTRRYQRRTNAHMKNDPVSGSDEGEGETRKRALADEGEDVKMGAL